MWPTDSGRRGQRERDTSDPRDRDRKRKREKEHTKEDKRDKQDKHEKHDKHEKQQKNEKQDKHEKQEKNERQDKYAKRDGQYDRGGGEEQRRQQDPHVSSRGPDNRDSDRSRGGRQGEARPDDGRQSRGERNKEPEVVHIPPIEVPESESAQASKKDWREEMGGEDERDLSDDEDVTARKLAESRKRREAMMAKIEADKAAKDADTQETQEKEAEEPAIAPRSPGEPDKVGIGTTAGDGNDSEAYTVPERKEEDEASRKQKKEVAKFMDDQRKKEEQSSKGDMFGDSAENIAHLNSLVSRGQSQSIGLTGASGDDWDDQDGYYIAKIGEVMDDRYLVVENVCGKGVFSNVIKAKDQVEKSNGTVAIKVMRANDMMKKAAEKEIEILQLLNNADKGNKRHVIRLLSTFYYRKHLCLVFECMWDDLRAALKKYTKNKGMALQAIRAYTKQLMVGLRHMHKCNIIHADIKPDNILINEGHSVVKFCDLGTALEAKDAAITPYLVSRFYRAPEIILGCEYGMPVDVFALGATLYELFTGKILLNSKTNNDALRKLMEIKGKIPKNVIKKGMLWKNHFDDALDFKYEDVDQYTKKVITRTMTDLNAKKDLFDLLMERVGPEKKQSTDREDLKTVTRVKQFADLLHQMLAIDPEKRITANDALSHPFLEDRLGSGGDRGAGAPPKR